jgi:hypothetical protein
MKKMKLKLKKGALHKTLGVKKGAKIPVKELEIKDGDSVKTKKRKQFAINASKWNKGGGHKGKMSNPSAY